VLINRLRLYVGLIALSVAAGLLYAFFFSGKIQVIYTHIAFVWLFGSGLTWGFELFFMPSRFGASIRRLHFITVILLKALVLGAIIAATAVVSRLVLHGGFDPAIFFDPDFYQLASYVFFIVIIGFAVLQVVRIIGGRELLNFILGKYHRPVREERIFMFLDLVGSTALAERLGDLGVQELLTRFFFDINAPIVEFGGAVHRYVGDMVIITWPLQQGEGCTRALQCYFAITAKVRELGPDYEKAFGVAPAFRVGLHGGPVVVSECGDQKQEIVYFGDTVNITARIEEQCKEFDCPILISGELLAQTDLPANLRAEFKGCVQLRGRQAETELFTIAAVDAAS
jgi:adenylate cyclase